MKRGATMNKNPFNKNTVELISTAQKSPPPKVPVLRDVPPQKAPLPEQRVVEKIITEREPINKALFYALCVSLIVLVTQSACIYYLVQLRVTKDDRPLFPLRSQALTESVRTASTVEQVRDWVPHLRAHLERDALKQVMCMHHLQIKTPLQACALFQGSAFFVVVNPRVRGHSIAKNVTVMEQTQQCVTAQERVRHQRIVVEYWELDGTLMTLIVDGSQAWAMQMVLEEFQGYECAEIKVSYD